MVKVSVTIGTARPGGIDVSLRGMADQIYDDFEIILVDARYHKRHAKVLDFAKSIGLRAALYHVPNHRFNGDLPTVMGGMNTGFMLACGEIVMMLMDYSYAPAGWIQRHLKYHVPGKRRLLMAPHIYTSTPPIVTRSAYLELFQAPSNDPAVVQKILAQRESFDEISIFKEPFQAWHLDSLQHYVYPDQDPKTVQPEGLAPHYYMHVKNESFPLETVLAIGGCDENYDWMAGPGDNEIGYRFLLAGTEIMIAQDPRVYCPNVRQVLPRIVPRGWDYPATQEYYKRRQQEMVIEMEGKKLFMDHPPKSKNPYDMRERRKEIWHWRELSQEREAVIPRNEVPDETYFHGVK